MTPETMLMHAPHDGECKVQDQLPLCGADGVINALQRKTPYALAFVNVTMHNDRVTCKKCLNLLYGKFAEKP